MEEVLDLVTEGDENRHGLVWEGKMRKAGQRLKQGTGDVRI